MCLSDTEDYPQPLTDQQLIERQQANEQIFLTFEHRLYIRDMQYCTCFARGCLFCSGRGWRHTPDSMAFGHGLNASVTAINPYNRYTHNKLHTAWHIGKGTRAKAEISRIRQQFGITTEEPEQ